MALRAALPFPAKLIPVLSAAKSWQQRRVTLTKAGRFTSG
jgi:hypothetical protein